MSDPLAEIKTIAPEFVAVVKQVAASLTEPERYTLTVTVTKDKLMKIIEVLE